MNPFKLLGKRYCAGELLARQEVFLYLASLLQRYTFGAVNGKEISLEESVGITLNPKYKQCLVFNKRCSKSIMLRAEKERGGLQISNTIKRWSCKLKLI